MENSVLKSKHQKIMSKKGKENSSVAFVILQLGDGGCWGEWPTLRCLPVVTSFPAELVCMCSPFTNRRGLPWWFSG